MKKVIRLKSEARESSTWRGHTMKRFEQLTPTTHESTCKVCGAYVQVDTKPLPNGIDISGNAVALGCPIN